MALSKKKLSNLKDPKILLSLLLQLSIVLLSVAAPLLYPQQASATVTEGFVRFDRLATGATISGTACLKSTLTTQTKTEIVFPQGWTVSGTAGNWTVSTTGITTQEKDPVGGGAAEVWPGINTATSVVGLTVIFPTTAFTAGHFYCFYFTGASSTVGSAGNDKTGELKTQGGAPYTDDMVFATSVVAAAGEQIVVSASVSATMSFSLTANSIALGSLTTGTTAQGVPTITESVSTNARNGWTTWVKSANGALSGTGGSISSPGSYDGTVETLTTAGGYVLAAAAGSGSPTVYAEWLDGASTDKGGHLSTTFSQVATKTTPGASDTVVYTARARAAATTPAATDYTDTLTITAAGSF
jgi:hypothetical protein